MKLRIISGITVASLLSLLIFFGPTPLMQLVIVSSAALGYFEFDKLFFRNVSKLRRIKMIILVVAGIVAIHQSQLYGWFSLWFAFIVLILGEVVRADRAGDFGSSTRELSLEILAYVYMMALFGFLMPVAGIGREYLFMLFLVVFIGDTAAYFVGSRFGKHKLVPKLSPKKTVEGAIGALVVSTIATYLCVVYVVRMGDDKDFILRMLIFAPFGSLLAQAGDLFESLLKRSQAQKDSGAFLPGHGGMLDRVDSLALVAPVYYIYLKMALG